MARFYTDSQGRVRPISSGRGGRRTRFSKSGGSLSGKLPGAGIVHEGELTKHGYHLDAGEETRHESLEKAVREDGYEKTQQRLTALQVVNKSHPTNHRKIIEDQEWLRRRYRNG